jgi:hypothetical protein
LNAAIHACWLAAVSVEAITPSSPEPPVMRPSSKHSFESLDDGSAYSHKVLALLRRRGLLSQERIDLLLSWRRSGFSVSPVAVYG